MRELRRGTMHTDDCINVIILSFIVFDGVFRTAEQGTTTNCRQTNRLTDRRITNYYTRLELIITRTSQKRSRYTHYCLSVSNISDKIILRICH